MEKKLFSPRQTTEIAGCLSAQIIRLIRFLAFIVHSKLISFKQPKPGFTVSY